MLASVGLRRRGCGLAVNGGPNRVRHPTDRSFTSWCSPPPLARTQFHSVTAARPATDRDFHPAGSIHLQSHSPPARAGGTAGRWAFPVPGNPNQPPPPTRPIRDHHQKPRYCNRQLVDRCIEVPGAGGDMLVAGGFCYRVLARPPEALSRVAKIPRLLRVPPTDPSP
jgi:hypothetical protein